MKRVVLLGAMLTIAAFVQGASRETDVLIWDISLYDSPAEELAEKYTGFTSISSFVLQGNGNTIDLSGYTYGNDSLSGTTGLSSGISSDTANYGSTGLYYTKIGDVVTDFGITEDQYGAYEFLMQLNDNNGNLVAWSAHLFNPAADPLTLSALKDTLVDIGDIKNPTMITTFNFGTNMVPEPTSGLLMMLGAGLLALRRRRRA